MSFDGAASSWTAADTLLRLVVQSSMAKNRARQLTVDSASAVALPMDGVTVSGGDGGGGRGKGGQGKGSLEAWADPSFMSQQVVCGGKPWSAD